MTNPPERLACSTSNPWVVLPMALVCGAEWVGRKVTQWALKLIRKSYSVFGRRGVE